MPATATAAAAAETCDRCGPGTRATTRVEVAPGLELWFCDHHARKHAEKLSAFNPTKKA